MFAEQDGATGRIPDTVQALIAARIDRLPYGEKTLLQRALGDRAQSSGPAPPAGAHARDGRHRRVPSAACWSATLSCVTRARAISGEKSYRFKHVLIREVAYGGLSKLARAELHSRFADWVRRACPATSWSRSGQRISIAPASLFAELDGAPPAELAREAAHGAREGRQARAGARSVRQRAQAIRAGSSSLEPTIERSYLAARAAWRLGDFAVVDTEMDAVLREARAGRRSAGSRAGR